MDSATPATTNPREQGLAIVGLMVLVMWVSEVIDSANGHKFDQYGIQPHEADGLTEDPARRSSMLGLGATDQRHRGVHRDGRPDRAERRRARCWL